MDQNTTRVQQAPGGSTKIMAGVVIVVLVLVGAFLVLSGHHRAAQGAGTTTVRPAAGGVSPLVNTLNATPGNDTGLLSNSSLVTGNSSTQQQPSQLTNFLNASPGNDSSLLSSQNLTSSP